MTAESLSWIVAGVHLCLIPLTLGLATFERRRLDGVNPWRKPLKFAISLAIFFATLAWTLGNLSAPWRGGYIAWATVALAGFAAFVEMAYIMRQAGHCEHSHFNLSTPWNAAMYTVMALGAVAITLAYGVAGVLVLVDRDAALEPTLRLALALGLGSSCVATLVTGFAMGATLRRHVGVHDPKGGLLPVTGWSRTAGDLRVPHFLASHVAQLVPLAGWLTVHTLPAPLRGAVVIAMTLACATAIVVTLRGALQGRPLLPALDRSA